MVPSSAPLLLRKLPSVDELLREPSVMTLVTREGRAAVTDSIRTVLGRLRDEILSGQFEGAPLNPTKIDLALGGLEDAVARELARSLRYSLRPVINATGVILHTNLGRAPLSSEALDHVQRSAQSYSNLEFDLERGERGRRDVHVDRLFQHLLGSCAQAEKSREGFSTIVVNNNASAVMLRILLELAIHHFLERRTG